MEQLTCLKAVLDAGLTPYADFAIFGPHQSRRSRKMKLLGNRFMSDGIFGPIEIQGPENLDHWLMSWRVFKNSMIILGSWIWVLS